VILAHAAPGERRLIALLVAALGIANTNGHVRSSSAPRNWRVRAMGWSPPARDGPLILLEAAALRRGGGVVGVALGWGARTSRDVPQTASIVSSICRWRTLLDGLIMAILVGVAAGSIPAWRGAQLSRWRPLPP